jgi:hypothetical protein
MEEYMLRYASSAAKEYAVYSTSYPLGKDGSVQEEEKEEEQAKEVDGLSLYLPPSLPASPAKISFVMPSAFFLVL